MQNLLGFLLVLILVLSFRASSLTASPNYPDYFQHYKIVAKHLGITAKQIVLTFDDGPSIHSKRLLEVLLAYKVPATFFVVNDSINRLPKADIDEIFTLIKDNPELFNLSHHSSTHRNFFEIRNKQDLAEEFVTTHKVIQSYLSDTKDYIFFRAPYGNFNNPMSDFYNGDPDLAPFAANYVGPVYWDIGGFYDSEFTPPNANGTLYYRGDYACWNAAWMKRVQDAGKSPTAVCTSGYYQEVLKRKSQGMIILAHDFWKSTVDMFVGKTEVENGEVVKEDPHSLLYKLLSLKALGYEIVALDHDVAKVEEVKNFKP